MLRVIQWATGSVGTRDAKAGRDVDDICRLLASGKNVVSTAVTGLI
jgi:hypothetical protein